MTDNAPRLKFISLNIEGSKHLERVLLFLEQEKPDVLCMQELFESDIPLFKDRLSMHCLYAPLCRWDQWGTRTESETFGTALWTRMPFENHSIIYYVAKPDPLPVHIPGKPEAICHAFLSAEAHKEGQTFMVGTTHFVWTPNGETSERQRQALPDFLKAVAARKEIVFAGDFNAPRGREIFSKIAAVYKDNIPPECKTTLDAKLHRAGALEYVVDGLFTSPHYIAENVRLADGISDHLAIVAEIHKA